MRKSPSQNNIDIANIEQKGSGTIMEQQEKTEQKLSTKENKRAEKQVKNVKKHPLSLQLSSFY